MNNPEAFKEDEVRSIKFVVPGLPFGKQRPKVTVRKFTGSDGKEKKFAKAYTPEKTVNYENLVKMAYQEKAKGERFKDGDMLDVRIIAYYNIPPSTSKKRRTMMLEHKIRPTKKPDWDNIGKIVCDSLNNIAYHDDRSILRNAYRSWHFKRRIQEIEGIGIERDLAGLPVIYTPEDMDIWNSEDETISRIRAELENMVRGVRRDEREGLVLPGGFKMELLSTGGSRQFDTNAIIDRYDTRIAMTVLADFIFLGHQQNGSWALSSDKTELFAMYSLEGYSETNCFAENASRRR